MTKFKNFWRLSALVCLAVCMCLFLAACGGGDEDPTTQSTKAQTSTYIIRVNTMSGVSLNNVSVYVYTDATMKELETMKPLESNGSITFEAPTSTSYVAVLEGVPKGYNVQEYYTINRGITEIVLTPSVITDEEKPANKIYAVGDIVYDFSITASDGTEYTLSELLQEKDAVVLNFWYLNCQPCKLEFPYLEKAYKEYSDQIEVLGINCEDGNDAELNAFQQEYELTFPLAIGDKSYWYQSAYMACPTTIVIDRYGTIVYMHTGYFDEVAPFNAMFRIVTADDYEQVFIQDIEDHITSDDYRPDGSKERPYELGGMYELDVKAGANELVHYRLYRLFNVTMRIENPDAYVVVDEQTYYPDNGVIEVVLTCPDTFSAVNVAFGNSSNAKNTIHATFIFEPGTVTNPIQLVLGDNNVRVTDINGIGTYYKYTAANTGVLTLTVQGCTNGATPDIHLYNENTEESVYLSRDGVTDPETGKTSLSITINEGDQLQIVFSAATAEEVTLPNVTIQALASVQEGEGSDIIDGKTPYSVTVIDQHGNPVPDAQILLSSAAQNTALITDENGRVSIRLVEGAYFLNLTVPSGYVADVTSYLWSPAMTNLVIEVSVTAVYSVQIDTAYGRPLRNVLVRIYTDEAREDLMYAISTDSSGMLTFLGRAGSKYYMTLSNVSASVNVQDVYVTTGLDTMIHLAEEQADPDYTLGDTVEDFTVTDIDGNRHSLQELLQQKDMVILAFWRGDSVECIRNLNVLQQIYDRYGEKVAILALNPVDTLEAELQLYQTYYELTYPLAMCDREMAESMGVSNFPTTVVIDRQGKVCLVQEGEISVDDYGTIVSFYTARYYFHKAFESLEALLNYRR